ncbi:hypothetical protein ABZX92_09545 [Lentzea sp. NPDC006480]|uniref:hypothetical protein n=1 Tax=Lentzea sp. NPDC006480 TaxID=3157176 RepID=UPI0033A420B5
MKDLLEHVMPEFEPVPDRADQVRRRAKVRRDRRLVAGTAAVVLAVAAGAGVMAVRPFTEITDAAAPSKECDAVKGGPSATPLKVDSLPPGASKVTLCVYKDGVFQSGALPAPVDTLWWGPPYSDELLSKLELEGAKVQSRGVGAVESAVNAMTVPEKCDTPSGTYMLEFEYPDRKPVVAWLSDKCGVPIAKEELLRDGDVLTWLHRMDGVYLYYAAGGLK